MRFTGGKTSVVMLCLAIAILALPVYAVTSELVGSAESHSIEKYDRNGIWIQTFASTGPYFPVSIAASPVTGDVFAATLTPTILRYTKTGAPFGPDRAYWTTFNTSSLDNSNPPISLLFDRSGDLYVATVYGEPGFTVEIFKYPAKELLTETPVPVKSPIITTVGQSGQIALDGLGNICVASWYVPESVKCYNPSTGALAFDYSSEIQAAGIQPIGIAFNASNILTVSSLFTGEVYVEAAARVGPLNLLATGTVQPAEVGWLAVDSTGNLYLPEWHNGAARYGSCTFYQCIDSDTSSDLVYKIDPSGTVTNFITSHIWGPYQMIFVPF